MKENLKKVTSFNSKHVENSSYMPTYHHCGRSEYTRPNYFHFLYPLCLQKVVKNKKNLDKKV